MKKHFITAVAVITTFLIVSCTAPKQLPAYHKYDQQPLGGQSKTALFVKLNSINIRYINNVLPVSNTEFNDSFYLDAANELAFFRISNLYNISDNQIVSLNTKEHTNKTKIQFSIIENDTLLKDSACEIIKEIAQKNNADYVIIPYSCEIKYSALQPESWRNYSGSYEQPVTYTASANFHLQIWNKKGELLFEKKGSGKNGRPMFYNTFKRKKPDENIVSYAKKLYAPPMVRALNEAIQYATKY